MNIEVLTKLRNNPAKFPNRTGNSFAIEGISLSNIEQLEQNWNNGNPFPKALRELLFLAGDYCYVLDYNLWEDQQEMQEELRDVMQSKGHSFSRPFYIIDNYAGGSVYQFLFVYLDGDQIDPIVHEYYVGALERGTSLDRSLGQTLSSFISIGIDRVRDGRNPM
ncbi:hypothetical protein JL193_08040 [Polaribacter batillariae]|uniref:SMI1 / KNR4 family (SUKH-1) n=1 Tax=Polaribacter batillariae TaxID=2808900 RepID=A0ABX7SY90_9FLAO|nr:hypothetical protein [Polaribacter batillariae]QTD39176.1 hypothetical protein JL193_08040 [Polaribacter batillariae]